MPYGQLAPAVQCSAQTWSQLPVPPFELPSQLTASQLTMTPVAVLATPGHTGLLPQSGGQQRPRLVSHVESGPQSALVVHRS
jgi:hypothetical protein